MPDEYTFENGKLVKTTTSSETKEFTRDELMELVASATARLALLEEDVLLVEAEKSAAELLLTKYDELS